MKVNKPDSFQLCNYDDLKGMSQYQLELSFLSCLYHEPDDVKKYGLCGLDRSMFQHPELFDFVERLMRCDYSNPSELPDDILRDLVEQKLCSLLDRVSMEALPSFYRLYAQEIEKRSQIVKAPWI